MVRTAFTKQERANSNVSGRNNKLKLDPLGIKCGKEATFQMYSCATGASEVTAWPQCIIAIDEM